MTQRHERSAQLLHVAHTRVTFPTGPAPVKAVLIRVKADAYYLRSEFTHVRGREFGRLLEGLASILVRLMRIAEELNNVVPDPLALWPCDRERDLIEVRSQLDGLWEVAAEICQTASQDNKVPSKLFERAIRAVVTTVACLGLTEQDLVRTALGRSNH